jgi:hypothetical protein
VVGTGAGAGAAVNVWCGVVWCGVVWCGVVWCGVVWYGMVWYGMYTNKKNTWNNGLEQFQLHRLPE